MDFYVSVCRCSKNMTFIPYQLFVPNNIEESYKTLISSVTYRFIIYCKWYKRKIIINSHLLDKSMDIL